MVRDLVAIFGVIAGFSYYVLTVQNNKKNQELALKAQQQQLETRQAQLFMSVYNTFTGSEFKLQWNDIMYVWEWDDYEDWKSKYGGPTNPTELTKIDTVGTFFEGIGVLVKRGFVDVHLVDDLMSGHIVSGWERFYSIFESMREELNWPQMLEWWEYLYHEVKQIMEKQHPELIGQTVAQQNINTH